MASVLSAAQEKEKGNAAFKAGRFADAVGHYSAAIITDQQDHTLPLNRAAAYLKLSKNRDAERDCSRTLELSKNNVKALYRRAQARIALRNLPEARLDLENALLLDSGNSAVKDELARIIDLLEKEKAQTHAGTSGIVPPPLQLERPKRRRVPIKIVEPEQTSPVQPTSFSTDLLKLSSSRPLSETPSLATQPSSPLKPADSNAAQQTRAIKSGGGIFRSSGSHQIFTSSSANMDATVNNKTKTPVPSPIVLSAPVPLQDGTQLPLTFFSFARNWNALASPADRWQLLSHISPSVLPSLFQTSLETPLLVSVLSTFQALLTSPMYSHQLDDLRRWIRVYLSAFPRVSRFVTVLMLMNSSERALLQDVLAGVGADETLSASWR